MNIRAMMKRTHEAFVLLFLALLSKATSVKPCHRPSLPQSDSSFCLSWRLAVETNTMRGWRTVPIQCFRYVESYMIGGQYERDIDFIVGQVLSYAIGIALSDDGMDAWILDVDDTCISNLFYYKSKRYGCDPFDSSGFKAWAMTGGCPAVPGMLGLFSKLVNSGFKVFMVTGRDEATLGQITTANLHDQGFVGYERLILRTPVYKGQSAVVYKSNVRRQLVEQGYRIWGNIGDQWTDLQGDCVGNRTFKLPNPMMNDADVSKQIQQMVRFIRQEAEEKANEISVSAEEEFNIEKLQIVEAEKKKIRQEYDRKAKQVDVKKKIEYSMQLNASRIKVLQAQDDIVNSMKESAGKDLLKVADGKKAYKKLLKDLIVQSLLRLKEPAVLLRNREVDKKVVESVLEEVKKAYADKANVPAPKITVDDRVFLPPPPKGGDSHEPYCSGGVVVASQDGKIVCENTLDARLDVVYRQKLPEIRKRLLG